MSCQCTKTRKTKRNAYVHKRQFGNPWMWPKILSRQTSIGWSWSCQYVATQVFAWESVSPSTDSFSSGIIYKTWYQKLTSVSHMWTFLSAPVTNSFPSGDQAMESMGSLWSEKWCEGVTLYLTDPSSLVVGSTFQMTTMRSLPALASFVPSGLHSILHTSSVWSTSTWVVTEGNWSGLLR